MMIAIILFDVKLINCFDTDLIHKPVFTVYIIIKNDHTNDLLRTIT